MEVRKESQGARLMPAYGKYLASKAEEMKQRIVAKNIVIPSWETVDNWEEIEEAEAEEIRKAKAGSVDAEQMNLAVSLIGSRINAMNLSPAEALQFKDLYPVWGKSGKAAFGTSVEKGFRFRVVNGDESTLYEVIQPHVLQAEWVPGMDTASLYKVVTEEHEGTKEDPIPYEQGMAFEEGQFYTQYGIVYECILTTETGYPNDLSELNTIVKPVEE